MGEMYFVLMTVIALQPLTFEDDRPDVVPGDIISSALIGGADTKEGCETGASLLAQPVQESWGENALVTISCPALPESVGTAQEFKSIKGGAGRE